jgi:hypothetical protein
MMNYRTVSLLTAFSKELENVTCKSFSCYLQDNNILLPEQFGFRKGTSAANTL